MTAAAQVINNALAPVLRAAEGIVVILGLLMVGIVFGQVVLRYTTDFSFYGSEELTRFLFTWFLFLSATIGLNRGMHFSVSVFGDRLKGRATTMLRVVVLLIVLAVVLVLIVSGWTMTLRNWRQLSSALQVPLSFANSAIPICATIMFFITVRDLIQAVTTPAPRRGDLKS